MRKIKYILILVLSQFIKLIAKFTSCVRRILGGFLLCPIIDIFCENSIKKQSLLDLLNPSSLQKSKKIRVLLNKNILKYLTTYTIIIIILIRRKRIRI